MSTKKIIRELQREGYTVTQTGGDHLKITHPTKPGMVFTGATPSDNKRSEKNLASVLRRTFGKSEE